ncbi:MAG TPA: hypothetical protein VES03_08820 [Motilibacterales bacterium]|nr:hypothetical protein [Motilibacterales bacterium]
MQGTAVSGAQASWAWRVGALVAIVALSVSGCQREAGTATPSSSESAAPSTTAAPGPARPVAEDFLVARSRPAVSQVATTWSIVDGFVTDIEVDPGLGEVYVNVDGSLQVLDMASRATVTSVNLPGNATRLAADPWAGVLYATRGGARGELITVIDTATHEITRTIEVDGATLWGIAVDPTTGLIWVMEEGPAGEGDARLAVIEASSGHVVARIPVDAEAGAWLAVDPVRGLVLVVENGGRGRMVVIDAARREVLRTVQVMPGLDVPCPNCMFYLGAPVVDPTTGLVYVSGSAPRTPDPDVSLDPDVPEGALGPAEAVIVPAGRAHGSSPAWAAVPAGGDIGGSVFVVDPGGGAVVDTVAVPGMVVWSRACDPAAGAVYLSVIGGPATGVRALDTETLKLGDTIPIEGDTTLAVDPTTGRVWVAGNGIAAILE